MSRVVSIDSEGNVKTVKSHWADGRELEHGEAIAFAVAYRGELLEDPKNGIVDYKALPD